MRRAAVPKRIYRSPVSRTPRVLAAAALYKAATRSPSSDGVAPGGGRSGLGRKSIFSLSMLPLIGLGLPQVKGSQAQSAGCPAKPLRPQTAPKPGPNGTIVPSTTDMRDLIVPIVSRYRLP